MKTLVVSAVIVLATLSTASAKPACRPDVKLDNPGDRLDGRRSHCLHRVRGE